MPQWTLLGLLQGKQTAPWPLAEGTDGQARLSRHAALPAGAMHDECKACADICPTKAITMRASSGTSRQAGYRLRPLHRLPALHRGVPDRSDDAHRPIGRSAYGRAKT